MKITIHRGANQIGGCIIEIESAKGDRIFIDFGHNLPEGDKKSDDKFENPNRDDFIITSYTVGPKGEIIYSFKGDDDGDEAIEMLWGLIWGEETQEAIEQYASEQ